MDITTLENWLWEAACKEYHGIFDKEILNLAREFNTILITEDSDFGEWVFAHKENITGVIFLRYKAWDFQNITSSLIALLNKYGTDLYGKFTVVTTKKIRMRSL